MSYSLLMIHKIDQYLLGRLYCSQCKVYQLDLRDVVIKTSNKPPYLTFYTTCPSCDVNTEFKLRGKYVSDKTLFEETNKEALEVLYDIRKILVAIIIFSLLMLIYSSLKDIWGV